MDINVISIPNDIKSFNELEQAIFSYICQLGVKLAKETLEQLDDKLAEQRDKKIYRYKEKRSLSIETLMGTVTYCVTVKPCICWHLKLLKKKTCLTGAKIRILDSS